MKRNKSILFAPVVAKSISCPRPEDGQAEICKDTKNAPQPFFHFPSTPPSPDLRRLIFACFALFSQRQMYPRAKHRL